MLKIQKLKRATRKSGNPLAPRKSTTVRKVTITNLNDFPIYVDKWTRKDYKKPKKKSKARKKK